MMIIITVIRGQKWPWILRELVMPACVPPYLVPIRHIRMFLFLIHPYPHVSVDSDLEQFANIYHAILDAHQPRVLDAHLPTYTLIFLTTATTSSST